MIKVTYVYDQVKIVMDKEDYDFIADDLIHLLDKASKLRYENMKEVEK